MVIFGYRDRRLEAFELFFLIHRLKLHHDRPPTLLRETEFARPYGLDLMSFPRCTAYSRYIWFTFSGSSILLPNFDVKGSSHLKSRWTMMVGFRWCLTELDEGLNELFMVAVRNGISGEVSARLIINNGEVMVKLG
ncbi:hypothetical protein V6N11_072092 [Hibiscus sabdariffa]|uniref:Uncharacterized protein n=1 Tax=Hibiscus sabdariffa TaxID=183260 RepID=A0ABR2U2M5_9ROSI